MEHAIGNATGMKGLMADIESKVVFVIWEDCRMLISALKKQRWSVVQWVVTVNIASSAAAVSNLMVRTHAYFMFLAFEAGVSILGGVLLYHYNARITKVRERLTTTVKYIGEHYFDYSSKLGLEVGGKKGAYYDQEELLVFCIAIIGSIIPIAVITVIGLQP